MEGLALLAIGLFLAGPILAIVALVRSRRIQELVAELAELRQRLERIEDRLSRERRREIEQRHEAERHQEGARHSEVGSQPEAEKPEAARAVPQARPPEAPPVVQAAPDPVPVRPAAPRPESAAPAGRPAPPGAAGPPPLTLPPTRPPSAPIDWERWIGIRGAAVLGAVALGLAGLLFFRYSIEHGLVTPLMRIVSGTLTGLGCLVAAEWLRARDYRATAEAVSGAGLIILYAAFWAGHILYHLIAMPAAFAMMVLVTVTACLLALRHDSLLVAVLGLAGGFATPLLLSSGADRPIGLFGYVLMLDLGMLVVGARRRWPSLGLLCLAGTTLMQALWIGARMGPDRLPLGLAVVGLFAFLFVAAGQRMASRADADDAKSLLWARGQMAGVLVPFAFAFYFAARSSLTEHLYPIALLVGPLVAGAAWVARGRREPVIATGAAAASLAIVGVWMMQHPLTTPLAWEMALTLAALAAITHLFVELDPVPHAEDGPAPAALVAALGSFVLLIAAAARHDLPPWPWLAGWLVIAALLYRHAEFPRRAYLQVVAAAGLGLGLSILHLAHPLAERVPAPAGFLAMLVTLALAAQAAALARGRDEWRTAAEQAAALLPVILLVGLAPARFMTGLGPALALGSVMALGLLAAFAATRLGSGIWYALAGGATLLVQFGWTKLRPGLASRPDEALLAYALEALTVVMLTFWPLLAGARLVASRPALYAAALAGVFWFPALRDLHRARFGDGAIGLLPLLLGALALGAAAWTRRLRAPADPGRDTALVWFSAVAISFVALAIPLQLHREWITIGWALEGLALLALWKRLDHPGLKWFALLLFGAASMRLVANPAVLGYYPRSATRLVNWLTYTYLVPAAALVAGGALLRPLEVVRARSFEVPMYRSGRTVGAAGAGFAAIAVVFVWLNLTIADWFATGETLTLSFGTEPAQRLTVSIAWALYALLLLGLGMARRAMPLRWISLAFLLVTIGKVFLYDLGALKDLYRVASLVGLAVSLILVSLLYQRFVFRGTREARP